MVTYNRCMDDWLMDELDAIVNEPPDLLEEIDRIADGLSEALQDLFSDERSARKGLIWSPPVHHRTTDEQREIALLGGAA